MPAIIIPNEPHRPPPKAECSECKQSAIIFYRLGMRRVCEACWRKARA